MVNNIDRSDWAGEAVRIFADRTMGGEIGSEAVADLICDLGHFAEFELGLSGRQVIALFEVGIGAWSAERRASDENPLANDLALILLQQAR